MKIYRLGELFSGAVGFAWGAIHADVSDNKIIHVWANGIECSTCATYIKNICPDNPDSIICCDVRDLRFTELENIDALAFGFPLNDFSIVGKRAILNEKMVCFINTRS